VSPTYLIDTDWAIDYLTAQTDAQQLLTRLSGDGLAISLVSYVEILDGIIGGRNRPAAERVFTGFLRLARVLDISRAVADRTATIRADLRRQRKPVKERALDLFIAATAIEHGLTLVTRNTRHYRDIPGLVLYDEA
jgi:predicted nucleic acid-binding protein